jgi:hypothetical protein
MASTPSIRIVKSSAYKGGLRLFSNRYHFNGGTPADATHWHTLMDAVTAAEKAIYGSHITITEALGYAAGSDVPVATKTYSLAGTMTVGGTGVGAPLTDAVLGRWSTAARSTKNHPIYLFNYFHGAVVDNTVLGFDKVWATQVTAVSTYITAWITGFSDGSITAVRASPNGAAATGSLVEEYVTHRDFPYQSSV